MLSVHTLMGSLRLNQTGASIDTSSVSILRSGARHQCYAVCKKLRPGSEREHVRSGKLAVAEPVFPFFESQAEVDCEINCCQAMQLSMGWKVTAGNVGMAVTRVMNAPRDLLDWALDA